MSETGALLDVLLAEYNCLKSEQAQRIGFRDNLLYVTLGVFGAVVSFALSDPGHYYALLVIPWVCVILGWTYIVNDEKISSIGRYIRYELAAKVKACTGNDDTETLLGWEVAHRDDKHRKRRKIQQLIVDEITFTVSGLIALLAFWYLANQPSSGAIFLSCLEGFLLLALGAEMLIYADFSEGK
jgi:hypothetical protein